MSYFDIRLRSNLFLCTFLLLMIFSAMSFAGIVTDDIKSTCTKEYQKFPNIVSRYSIRLQDPIAQFGCGAIEIFNAFSEQSMDIINELEEDQDLMSLSVSMFSMSDKISHALSNPDIFKTLLSLKMTDEGTLNGIVKVLNSLPNRDSKRLSKQPKLILYSFLTALLIDDKTGKREIRKKYQSIKNKASTNNIDLFITLFLMSGDIYQNYSISERLDVSSFVLHRLHAYTIRNLLPYREYLAYFFPFTNDQINNVSGLSDSNLKKIKSDYVKLIDRVFIQVSKKYGVEYSVKVVEHIAPAIIEGLRKHTNTGEMEIFLHELIESPLFALALTKGVCSSDDKKKIDHILQNFLSMFSPYENGYPIKGTEGNLGLISRLFISDKFLRTFLNESEKEIQFLDNLGGFVYAMGHLPLIASTLKNKSILYDLVLSLKPDQDQKVNVIKNAELVTKIYKLDYFNNIQLVNDARQIVDHDDNVSYGSTSEKYKYILTTSYPAKDSLSLYYNIVGSESKNAPIQRSALHKLMRMSSEELSAHNFTTSDMVWAYIKNIEDTADVISIIAIPFTGGVSYAIAAAIAARKAAKESSKAFAKRIIKSMAKKSAKSISRLAGNDGYKAAWREGREIIGTAVKRGRRAGYHKSQQIIKQSAGKIGDHADIASNGTTLINISKVAVTAGMAYFLSTQYTSAVTDPCKNLKDTSGERY